MRIFIIIECGPAVRNPNDEKGKTRDSLSHLVLNAISGSPSGMRPYETIIYLVPNEIDLMRDALILFFRDIFYDLVRVAESTFFDLY